MTVTLINVTEAPYNAQGDGTTNDYNAIQNAIDDCDAAGGGIVFLPPTGAAYVIGTGLEVPDGVILKGAASKCFQGATATVAQWTSKGSWIRSTDTVNPTVTLVGHGAGVVGINFIRNQAIPGSGAYTPTLFPYEIKSEISFFTIDDVVTVGCTHDIWLSYSEASGGGTYSRITNFYGGGLQRGIKFERVNDTLYVENLHHRNMFYSSTPSLVNWIKNNKVDWDVGYLDNILGGGIEFFMSQIAMLFNNQTCFGNTHSGFNFTLDNIQFNLVVQAMRTGASDTIVRGKLHNVIAQSFTDGTVTSSSILFQLNSNNADVELSSLLVNEAGGSIAEIGAGSGGKLTIRGFECLRYSSVASGQIGLIVNNNAVLSLYSVDGFPKIGGAGHRIAGAGRVQSNQWSRPFFPTFVSIGKTLTGTGSWSDITTEVRVSPLEAGKVQARLIGQVEIQASVGGGTMGFRMGNYTEVSVTGIDASSTGWKSFDSGWIDLTSSNLLAFMGRLHTAGSNGVRIGALDVTLQLR